MEINQTQFKDIQKQAIFIGTSKLIALSMPMMDLMMLSHWSSYQALSDYVLSTHLVQVFIAIILALSVGVHIFFNQSENKVLAIRQNMAYAYMLTLIIAILSVIFFYSLDYIHHFSGVQQSTYFILIIGILTLPVYIILSHILDSMNKSKEVIYLTILLAISNLLLNYYFLFSTEMKEQIAIAISTTMVRSMGVIVLLFWLWRLCGVKSIKPDFNRQAMISLFNFGRSDLATNLIFAVGFALLFFYLNVNYSEQVMSYFGISLNIINLAFVFYIGFSSALSIHLSKGMTSNHALFIPVLNRFIFAFIIKSLMISLLFSPIFIGLYFGEFSYFYLLVVCLSLFIAAFDGLSVAFIARLRVMGYVKYPPLFRLLLIFIGMPLAIYLLPMLGVEGILIAFVSINFIVAMGLFLINRRIYHLKS